MVDGAILEEYGAPAFSVGDVVTIGDVKKCVFAYNKDMEDAYGLKATIRKVRWYESKHTYGYTIEPLSDDVDELDIPSWSWDINCFQEDQRSFSSDIESSDSEVICDLLGL